MIRWLHAVIALLATAASLASQEAHGLDVLREGHFLEVKGTFDDRGVFVASSAELVEPDDDVLIGTVAREPHRDGRFHLFDQEVAFTPKTEWQGVHADALVGERIKVEGRYRGPRKFSARKVSSRGDGRDRLTARIDAIEPTVGGVLVRVMRWDVFLAETIVVESEEAIADLELLPPRPVALQDESTDEDDLFGDGIPLFGDVSLFAQVELETGFEDEFDLNDGVDRDRFDLSASTRVRFLWEPSPTFTAVASWRGTYLRRDDQDEPTWTHGDGTIGETWGWWRDALGADVDLVVGRQDFDDPREWVYDQNLDAVRVVVRKPGWRLDLSASTSLEGSLRDEEATNLVAYLSNDDKRRHLAAYALHRDIDLPDDERPLHVGARVLGHWIPQNDLWLDVAGLGGTRAGEELSAYALDLGTTWSPPALAPFSFTVGYAFASGDADPGGTDHGYRQSGLQDNNDKFAGVTSFRYYGELFDPELANLRVLTAGVGARIADRTSLDLVAHAYAQDEPLASLVDSGLKAKPTGLDADIGTELDLIFGTRRFRDWDLEVVLGWFQPGAAFTNDDDAFLGKIQLRYRL